MAGHSKWANIKHKKNINDIKKNKLHTKLLKSILNIVKNNKNSSNYNFKLNRAIDKALQNNINKNIINNIISNIKIKQHNNFIIHRYAGYLTNGIAVLIECNVSNKNKVVSDLRYLFNKYNGNLVDEKSVSHLFEKVIKLIITPKLSNNIAYDILKNIDIKSFESKKNSNSVYINFLNYNLLKYKIKNLNYNIKQSIIMIPYFTLNLDKEIMHKVSKFLSIIKNLCYVKNIFLNINCKI